jgi:prophage tail gpP-like protein
MPMPNNDTVSVLIAGRVHSTWSRYQIDSDFLIPSDAWSVTLGLPGGTFPAYVERGAPVQVKIGDDTVMVGRVAKVQRRVSRPADEPQYHRVRRCKSPWWTVHRPSSHPEC